MKTAFVSAICLLLLFSVYPGFGNGYSLDFSGISILTEAYRNHLGDILWIKVDEFYHISTTMTEEDMLKLSELAFRLNPHNLQSVVTIMLHMANHGGTLEHAIKLGQNFIRENPKDVRIHKILGALAWLHFRHGQYDDAENAVATAIQSAKSDPNAFADGPSDFLFPLNYFRLLRQIYSIEERTSDFNIVDKTVKAMEKDFSLKSSPVEFLPEVSQSHHNAHHDNMKFVWERILECFHPHLFKEYEKH